MPQPARRTKPATAVGWPVEWTCAGAVLLLVLAVSQVSRFFPSLFAGSCTTQSGMCTPGQCSCATPLRKRELVTQDAQACYQCVAEFCPDVAEGDDTCMDNTCECEDPTWPQVDLQIDGRSCWQCVQPALDIKIRAGADGRSCLAYAIEQSTSSQCRGQLRQMANATSSCHQPLPVGRRLVSSKDRSQCITFRYSGERISEKRHKQSCLAWHSFGEYWGIAACNSRDKRMRFRQLQIADGEASAAVTYCSGKKGLQFCVEVAENLCTEEEGRCSTERCRCENKSWMLQELRTANGQPCFSCVPPRHTCASSPEACTMGPCECQGAGEVKVEVSGQEGGTPCFRCTTSRLGTGIGSTKLSIFAIFIIWGGCLATGCLAAGCLASSLRSLREPAADATNLKAAGSKGHKTAAGSHRAALGRQHSWSETFVEGLADIYEAICTACVRRPTALRRWSQPLGKILDQALDWFDLALEPFYCVIDGMQDIIWDFVTIQHERLVALVASLLRLWAFETTLEEFAPEVQRAVAEGGKSSRSASKGKVAKDLRCPGGHKLEEVVAHDRGFSCDGCGKSFELGKKMRACRRCNYDVCSDCQGLLKGKSDNVGAKAQSEVARTKSEGEHIATSGSSGQNAAAAAAKRAGSETHSMLDPSSIPRQEASAQAQEEALKACAGAASQKVGAATELTPTQKRVQRKLQQRREAAQQQGEAAGATPAVEPQPTTPIDESWIDELEQEEQKVKGASPKKASKGSRKRHGVTMKDGPDAEIAPVTMNISEEVAADSLHVRAQCSEQRPSETAVHTPPTAAAAPKEGMTSTREEPALMEQLSKQLQAPYSSEVLPRIMEGAEPAYANVVEESSLEGFTKKESKASKASRRKQHQGSDGQQRQALVEQAVADLQQPQNTQQEEVLEECWQSPSESRKRKKPRPVPLSEEKSKPASKPVKATSAEQPTKKAVEDIIDQTAEKDVCHAINALASVIIDTDPVKPETKLERALEDIPDPIKKADGFAERGPWGISPKSDASNIWSAGSPFAAPFFVSETLIKALQSAPKSAAAAQSGVPEAAGEATQPITEPTPAAVGEPVLPAEPPEPEPWRPVTWAEKAAQAVSKGDVSRAGTTHLGLAPMSVKRARAAEAQQAQPALKELQGVASASRERSARQSEEPHRREELEGRAEKARAPGTRRPELKKPAKVEELKLEAGSEADEVCSCGSSFLQGASFCASCGAKREEVCSCGSAFLVGASYCASCGARRSDLSAAASASSFTAEAPEFVPGSITQPSATADAPRTRRRKSKARQTSAAAQSITPCGMDVPARHVLDALLPFGEAVTTIMISGISASCAPESFRTMLDQWGLEGTYDFFFMPIDRESALTMGCAFINFIDASFAILCYWLFSQWQFGGSITSADIQGLENNLAHWQEAEEFASTAVVIANPEPTQWAVNCVNSILSPQSREQFHKTKLCAFYKKSRCDMGVECPFAHSPEELMPAPYLAKTKLCYNFFCRCCFDATCKFAHGFQELRAASAAMGGICYCPPEYMQWYYSATEADGLLQEDVWAEEQGMSDFQEAGRPFLKHVHSCLEDVMEPSALMVGEGDSLVPPDTLAHCWEFSAEDWQS